MLTYAHVLWAVNAVVAVPVIFWDEIDVVEDKAVPGGEVIQGLGETNIEQHCTVESGKSLSL